MRKPLISIAALLLSFLAWHSIVHAQTNVLWQGEIATSPQQISFKMPADKFNALRVFFSDEKSRIEIELKHETKFGKTKYRVKTSRNVNGQKGLEQLIDDLPQIPGDYELTIGKKAASFTVLLESLASIQPIAYGEAMGELIIENAGNSPITANPEQIEIKHPDFKKSMQKGVSTPDGKMYFKLPAGFWSLERAGSPNDNVQMIPVHSGRQTTIRWGVIPQISIDSSPAASVRRIDIREVATGSDDLLMARFALPAGLAKQAPVIDQIQVNERGLAAEIVDLTTSSTSLHLVLLLDSSGSMKKDMKTAIDSAVKFIDKLPEGTLIDVIDFDSKAKPIKAGSRSELVKAVKAIKADGATALRDSTILGLEKLKSSPRPALIVFTDGFDANHNDTAPGSKASEKDVFAKVTSTRVPIFTIGFGDGADEATLARLADLSGGFYQAANTANIDQVFAALEETVAREYVLTWRRPKKAGTGVKPVIAIAVDTSGSMNEAIEKEKPGEKFALAKMALHDLISRLPEEALIQLIDYDAETTVLQTLTTDRARMHKGIAKLNMGGGTDILKATKVCLEGLLSAPSNRRYLLFLTDEAIRQSGAGQKQFERLLDRIKDEKIFSMWLGMVDKKDFKEVADRSGGLSVVSKNFNALQQSIDELLAKISTPVEDNETPVEIIWKMPVESALPQPVSGTGLFELPPMKTDNEKAPEEIRDSLQIKVSEMPSNSGVNQQPKPDSNTARGPVVEKASEQTAARLSIPTDVTAENSACRFHVSSIELFDNLNGVNAAKDKVFVAIELTLNNLLPEQDVVIYPDGGSHPSQWIRQPDKDTKVIKAIPPYLVQDLRQHMFLRWNNETVPCSPAGWLLDDSLTPFNSHSFVVSPGKELHGKVVFMVSDVGGLNSGALDFFDTAYGNLSITLAGTPEPLSVKAATLPKSVGSRLGEAFSINVNSLTDQPAPLAGATAGTHLVYRLLDFSIDSKVQALLDLDAAKRMHLEIPTAAGPVRRPLSPATALIPGGFYHKVKLAPGSANYQRQAYLLPESLAKIATGTLCVEMKGEDCFIKLDTQEPQNAASSTASWTAEGNELKVRINSQGRLEKLHGSKGNWLIVDATVADNRDGAATRLENLFFLGRADLKDKNFKTHARTMKEIGNKGTSKGMGSFADNSEAQGESLRIQPDPVNKKMMFAANQDAVVPDGLELRFLTVFKLANSGEYLLASDYLPLQLEISNASMTSIPDWLLAINDEIIPQLPDAFEQKLADRLKEIAKAKKSSISILSKSPVADENGLISAPAEILAPPILAPEATLPEQEKVSISVEIVATQIGDNVAAQTNKAAAALGGKQSGKRSFSLFSDAIPANKLCKTPFELVYYQEVNKSGDKELKLRAAGIWGETRGKNGIDLKNWLPVREIIKITSSSAKWPLFEREIKDVDLTSRIHSIAAMLPDLNLDREESLSKEWAALKSELPPEHLSLWQWYAHSRIARFIIDQTLFEKKTGEKLGVKLNREKEPRLMVLTGGSSPDGQFEARLDLLSVLPEVEGDDNAAKAFRIANGMYLSELETRVMGGKGVFQFWGRNNLQIIGPTGKQKKAWLKFAEKQGVSERVISAVSKSKNAILFPEQPAIVASQPFWAWLEINPVSYETISVLETGEHGTIAGEAIIQALIPDGAAIALGFWKGIESSIWANCAFILRGDSHDEALDNTEELMGSLGENLGGIGDSFTVPVGDADLDLLSGKMSLAGFSSDGTYSPWDGYKGFSTGFEAGVAYYLGKARAGSAKQ